MPRPPEKRANESESKQACVLVITSAAMLVNFVAVVFGVYLITDMKHFQSRDPQATDPEAGVIACIKCSSLQAVDPLLKMLSVPAGDSSHTDKLCCAKNSADMSAIMEHILKKDDSSQRLARPSHILDLIQTGSFNFSRSSAHKRLLPATIFDSSTNQVPIFEEDMVTLRFNSTYNNPQREHARDVTVLDSGFEIVHPGTYHVYSSVHFKPDSNRPCGSFKFRTWEHKVIRKSSTNFHADEILKSVHTCCDSCTKDKETSFTSGAFVLGKGDLLNVNISGQGLLAFSDQSSYFGLMMLG